MSASGDVSNGGRDSVNLEVLMSYKFLILN
jgi:hypothetical protein